MKLAGSSLAIGLLIRIFLASSYYGNFDQSSYEIVAEIMKRGGNVYAETSRYNYSPLWAHILLVLDQLASLLGLPFHTVLRSCLSLIDLANAMLVGAIAARLMPGTRSLALASYALNPVAILLVGYHGQFETLALLPLLLATYLYLRGASPWSILALGTLSLLIKHLTVFLVWTLFLYAFGFRKAVLALLLSPIAFGAALLPYLPEGWFGILHNVVLYSSSDGVFGVGLFLSGQVAIGLFLLVMVSLPLFLYRRVRMPKALESSAVVLIATIPGFGVQYLLVPTMLGSVFRSVTYLVFTGVASVFLMANPANLQLLDVTKGELLVLSLLTTSAAWVWALTDLCFRTRPTNSASATLADGDQRGSPHAGASARANLSHRRSG